MAGRGAEGEWEIVLAVCDQDGLKLGDVWLTEKPTRRSTVRYWSTQSFHLEEISNHVHSRLIRSRIRC